MVYNCPGFGRTAHTDEFPLEQPQGSGTGYCRSCTRRFLDRDPGAPRASEIIAGSKERQAAYLRAQLDNLDAVEAG